MNVAIMQPYLFPYIGYFNLINNSDKFILYNDVNYIERGWINKNRIISKQGPLTFTFPIRKASSNKLISDLYFLEEKKWKAKFLKSIEITYRKAPMFDSTFKLLESIVYFDQLKIDVYIKNSLERILDHLGVAKTIIYSSEIEYDRELDRNEKLTHLAILSGANTMSFPEGSIELYGKKQFDEQGIATEVVIPNLSGYTQFTKDGFIGSLSIIDVLMFNSKEEVLEQLDDYSVSELNEFV